MGLVKVVNIALALFKDGIVGYFEQEAELPRITHLFFFQSFSGTQNWSPQPNDEIFNDVTGTPLICPDHIYLPS